MKDQIDELIRAREELVAIGVVEDSSERRPDQAAVMQVVWRISVLGHKIIALQEFSRLTFEDAYQKLVGVTIAQMLAKPTDLH